MSNATHQVNNGSGDQIATDNIGTFNAVPNVEAEYVKLMDGTAGSQAVIPGDATYGLRTMPSFPGLGRNPKWIIGWLDLGNIAPHSSTQRLKYTVPTARLLYIYSGFAFWIRKTAATNPSSILAEFGIGGNSATNVWKIFDTSDTLTAVGTQGMDPFPSIYKQSDANAVGQSEYHQLTMPLMVPTGCFVFANTSDASTGGTCTYRFGFNAVEFDA